MTPPLDLDLEVLRSSVHAPIRDHLRSLIGKHELQLVAAALYDAIHQGYIPPDPTTHIYLSIAQSPDAILFALTYPHSAGVRKAAIRILGKWFRKDDKFQAFWDLVGGVEGFMQVMARLSVVDVKDLCLVIGHAGYTPGCPVREREVTKLLVCLAGIDYDYENDESDDDNDDDGDDDEDGNTSGDEEKKGHDENENDEDESSNSSVAAVVRPRNPDNRPIITYPHLAPACSATFACWYYGWGYGGGMPFALLYKLFEAHPDGFHEHCYDESFPENYLHGDCLYNYWNLMRRSLDRRQGPHQQMEKAWGLIALCLLGITKGSGGTFPYESDEGERLLVLYAARFWKRFDAGSRKGGKGEIILRGLLDRAPEGAVDMTTMGRLLKAVNPRRRLPLLKMVLRHASQFDIDLDGPDAKAVDEKLSNLGQAWPLEVFVNLLPRDEAIPLLERLMALSWWDGCISIHDFDVWNSLLYLDRPQCNARQAVLPSLLLIHLKAQSPDEGYRSTALKEAARLTEEWKEKAVAGKDPEDRADGAVMALAYSVASGSLDALSQTLSWTTQFCSDTRTAALVYGHMLLRTDESIRLLAGIPDRQILNTIKSSGLASGFRRLRKSISGSDKTASSALVAAIQSSVLAGNIIFETLAVDFGVILDEDEIRPSQWLRVTALLGRIASQRLSRFGQLKADHHLTDDQLWDAVAKPTLDILLRHETRDLEVSRGNPEVHQYRPGPLGLYKHKGGVEQLTRTGERFLSELAEKRDQLWAKHRAAVQPGAANLAAPWPRGLPFQNLCNVEPTPGLSVPYLGRLAESIVFLDPTIAANSVPEDPGARFAIGSFVHYYWPCLLYYVKTGATEEVRRSGAARAWDHATTRLTGYSPQVPTPWTLWERVFKGLKTRQPSSSKDEAFRGPPLAFPPADESGEPVEWHPNSGRLDPSDQAAPPPYTLVSDITRRFHVSQFQDRSCRVRDPLAAVSMWSIDAKTGGEKTPFSSPFPKSPSPRYPAFYLDDVSLTQDPQDVKFQLKMLKKCRLTVPPALLEQLARRLWSRLDNSSEKDPDSVQAWYLVEIIRLLVRSDAPQLATSLVHDFIVNCTDLSRVYPRVLGRLLLRVLSSEDARQFFQGLVAGLQAKIAVVQGSSSESVADTEREKANRLVKIRMIRYIGHLLAKDAEYLDAPSVTRMSLSLMQASDEYWLWKAILPSMKSSFVATFTKDGVLNESVVSFMEQTLLPRLGSINETQRTTERDWNKFESLIVYMPKKAETETGYTSLQYELFDCARGILPDLDTKDDDSDDDDDDDGSDSDSDSDEESPDDAKRRLGATFLTRIIFPMIERSIEENARWTRAFLKHWGLSSLLPEGTELPPTPMYPKMINTVIYDHEHYIPKLMYDRMHAFCMALIEPSPALAEITRRVKEDVEIGESNGGKYWLSLWSRTGRDAVGHGLYAAAEQLVYNIWNDDKQRPRELTAEDIQKNTLEAFEAMMNKGEVGGCQLLMEAMTDNIGYHVSKAVQRSFIKWSMPVLEGAIALVEAQEAAWKASGQEGEVALLDVGQIKDEIPHFARKDEDSSDSESEDGESNDGSSDEGSEGDSDEDGVSHE
ncbi:unnamed protein product [Parascedosporium putredinis]|uniref:Uncharacterized protein n=1 Tax=Parascedosporium putredinis TaxID=1442378 RepID=A0A9P1H1Q5_9PEZI|nr:unnamed protein product [Parascedosporium putredinis]CAI7994000.1 unnamed protein product [Parascedosporium putredinis]